MKSYHFLFAALFAVALAATGCTESPYINGPGNNSNNEANLEEALPEPEWVDTITSAPVITVAEARAICAGLASQASTTEEYLIKGWVSGLDSRNESGIVEYGNGTFYITETSVKNTQPSLIAYQVMGIGGGKIPSVQAVQVGDFVVIKGRLTNYNGTYETVGRSASYIYASTNDILNGRYDTTLVSPDPEGVEIPEGTINVYQANNICAGLASGATTSEAYYIKGWVRSLHSGNANAISQYGNAQFFISPTEDDSAIPTFYAYQVYARVGQRFTDASQVQEGDYVIIYGRLTNYNGTYETVGRGAAYIYYSSNPAWQELNAQ